MLTALVNYFKESKAELQKVTWPSRDEAVKTTIAVIVLSFMIAVYLGGADFGLNKLLDFLLSR